MAPLLTIGCTASAYTAAADAEVAALLTRRTDQVLGDRETWVVPARGKEEAAALPPAAEPPPATEPQPEPEPEPEPEPTEGSSAGVAGDAGVRQIDLLGALHTAVQHNRDYLSRRETLYLQGLDTTRARFDFGPQIGASIRPFVSRIEGGPTLEDVITRFDASQILPTGGQVTANADFAGDILGKTFSLGLNQPLFRGAGYEVSHEALTQAERNLIYDVRDYELFRQDFSINVARAFFDLVSQNRTLANEEENLRQAVFDREKTEALFQVGRNDEQDIFRARRRQIDANDNLIDARARYRRAVDEFKILMGIPTAEEIEIVDQDPPFEPVRVDLVSAVEAARHNRLDLMTQRDRVEDARRAVRNADNGLLPDIDLNLSGFFNDSLGRDDEGFWGGTAELQIEIPLQRLPERNIYRATQIALERAQRALSLQLDNLELDIRDQLRQIDSLEQRIVLQREQIEQQIRAVTVSELQYERGELDNRDLLLARQSLVDAQNLLIQLQSDHFIRRLRLLRDLGLLFVDDSGDWR